MAPTAQSAPRPRTKARKPRSERSRWVQIFALIEPRRDNADGGYANSQHQKAVAIVRAFEKVGRVVRVEADGNSLVLKARRA